MKVAIIGAGFAGLTTARHLKEAGHEVTVFEKTSDVGGVWSKSRLYPGVSTQNGKDTYCLSDHPMPKDYPEWPSGPQVQAYIESYAVRFGLMARIRLRTEVQFATQKPDGAWTIVANGPSGPTTESYDFLVIANGIFSEPSVPHYPGQEDFRAAGGIICHSSTFTRLEDSRGKHVISVGYGKSSCDIAVGVEPAAKTVTVVARELIWKAPKHFGNLLNYKYLLLTRMGEALFPYIELKGFERFLHGVGRPVRNSMIGSVQALTTRQLGLKKLGLAPRGSFERIARSTVSLVTDGFFDLVRKGRITVERDTQIARLFVKDGARFAELANGKTLPCDIVLCGTGWTQDVPFLDDSMKSQIFDDRGNFRLFRCILPIGVRNLAFNGYNSSFFSPLSAEMGALWIASYMAGDLDLPGQAEQIAAIDRRLRWMETRTEGKHARGTNIIPFSMHQIDELLSDLRLPVGAVQRVKEWQMPVNPLNYAKVGVAVHKRLRRGASAATGGGGR